MTIAILSQTPPAGPSGPLAILANPMTMMVVMGVLFYFLLIRPQSKARKEMEARLSKLKAGDEVLLSSGLFATIDRVDDKDAKLIYIKLGSSVVKARRQAVAALASEGEPKE
ncbi:MAG: preprotein translocase subunit YajC [Acidobacteria bacterium]|nr:preprotein translocase subunit YajC [Acidobacteriota bacterium]